METIPVLIVGAGPSGLVLALTLAKYKVPVCLNKSQIWQQTLMAR